jgi:hypothetical protein
MKNMEGLVWDFEKTLWWELGSGKMFGSFRGKK